MKLVKTITAFFLGAIVATNAAGELAVPISASGSQTDLLRAHMNPAINPGVDFFEYANGAWLKNNPIPASESGWGIGNVVQEELYAKLRTINEKAVVEANAADGDQRKIANFWSTAIDPAKADRAGIAPLKFELERIDAAKTREDILDVCFALQPLAVTDFFGFSVSQDEKDSDVMSVHLSQGGLGLPDRDFYFNTEKGVVEIRKEYVAHIARMLKLLGRNGKPATKAAAEVMAFETELARVSRKLEDLRDPEHNYNKMVPDEVTAKYTPGINWINRLASWNLRPGYVIVGQPEFFSALDGLLGTTPVPVLQEYLRFHLAADYSEYLGRSFDEEYFRFYKKVLTGQKQPRPRWKRVLDSQEHAMGMVLGKIFVRDFFPEASKARYSNLVESIRVAYQGRIDRLDWMSDATKAKAQDKLARMTAKVGYPDRWKDYSALVVGTQSYCENMLNASRWRFNDAISKFGKPVDRTEWDMTPQTYNAYYKPEDNQIVLPAAIFAIPGMRDSDVDDAVAYGYAGASTIGHEITHGFDDEGRQFDAHGNLSGWWTEDDAAKFKKRAEAMVSQFNGYQPLPGLHINGQASLGENIADYGGVLLGLDAFKRTEQYKKGEKIGGLTPIQRYFLGYTLGWLFHEREARLRRNLLSDVHAPAKWRVIGPLANIPEFYQAFDIQTNQPMWRPDEAHVRIW